jgi:hypothetical protein
VIKCFHKKPHEKSWACDVAKCSIVNLGTCCIPYDLEYIMKEVIKKHEEEIKNESK